MTEGWDVLSHSSHPLSPWPGVKDILQPVSRAENASHPTSFSQWIHICEHTTSPTHQKCGCFLYLISCTPHRAHPKHTWNTNTSSFSAIPPTTEWKWTVKHRVEKMHGVIQSHGLRVITEKLAGENGGRKEPVALRKVYSYQSVSHLWSAKDAKKALCHRKPWKKEAHYTQTYFRDEENWNSALFLCNWRWKLVWRSRTLLTRTELCWDEKREAKLVYFQFVECRWR